jgi:hypothetical protein
MRAFIKLIQNKQILLPEKALFMNDYFLQCVFSSL